MQTLTIGGPGAIPPGPVLAPVPGADPGVVVGRGPAPAPAPAPGKALRTCAMAGTGAAPGTTSRLSAVTPPGTAPASTFVPSDPIDLGVLTDPDPRVAPSGADPEGPTTTSCPCLSDGRVSADDCVGGRGAVVPVMEVGGVPATTPGATVVGPRVGPEEGTDVE